MSDISSDEEEEDKDDECDDNNMVVQNKDERPRRQLKIPRRLQSCFLDSLTDSM